MPRVRINGGIVILFPLIFQLAGPRGRISTCGSSGRSVDGFREVTLQEAPWCMGWSIGLEGKLGGCGMASSRSDQWVTGVRTEGWSVIARMERASLSVEVAGSGGEDTTDGVDAAEAMVD